LSSLKNCILRQATLPLLKPILNFKRMKKILPIALMVSSAAFGQTVEDANILLGNLSGSLYWDSYNDNSKIVSNLNFSVYADGTNSDYVTPAFAIKVYLWDGSNPTFVHTFEDDGIHHFGGRDYVDEDIDISNNGLPAGSYRLGVYIDADDDISDSEDDPSDNAYLAPGELDYTPGGSSAGINEKVLNTLMVFPNPAAEKVTIAWENSSGEAPEKLEVTDLNGRIVKLLAIDGNKMCVNLNVSDLNAGIYVISVQSAAGIRTQKFIKQ
jgi:hypothetical protein